MTSRRAILPLLLAPAFAATRARTALAAGQTWQCYTYLPAATDPAYQALVDVAAAIGKASGGAIDVACHPGGSLPINASTIAQSIAENVLQFGLVDSLSYNSLVPAAGVLSLPGLFPSEAALSKGVAALLPMLNAAFARRNIVVFGVASYPLQVIYGTRKLISLADLKGMRLRVTTAEQAEFAVRFGATPITLGAPEVATSLQRGIIQGVLTSNVGGGIIWHGLLHYNLRTGPNYVSVMLMANKGRFDALPADLRQKIAALGLAASARITHILQSRENGLTETFRKEGMVITEGTPAEAKEIAARMRSYWPQWAKRNGPAAEKALALVEQAIQS